MSRYPGGTRGKEKRKILAKTLTAAGVAKLLPGHKRLEVPDAGSPGLRIVVQPTGAKSWALRFRRPDGRTAKMTLGRFDRLGEMEGEPVVGGPLTLAAARRLAADIMRQRALGKDVISDHHSAKRRRKTEAATMNANAFGAAAKSFIEQHARPQTRSWVNTARLLGLEPQSLKPIRGGLCERWALKPVGEISGDDIHHLVDEVRAVGVPGLRRRRTGASDSVARVIHGRLNKFFSWCRQKRITTSNPCVDVWRPPSGDARERTLTDAEIRWLWQAAGDLGYPFGVALRLLLLTGQRRGEVGGMRWDELSEDGSTWTLPASRAKNARAHVC
jgi:Arm DNA-binding domain